MESKMPEIGELSVVAVIRDLPEHGLVRGQVGTVVDTWAPGVFEVEFVDNSVHTYALAALRSEDLLLLVHEPAHRAA